MTACRGRWPADPQCWWQTAVDCGARTGLAVATRGLWVPCQLPIPLLGGEPTACLPCPWCFAMFACNKNLVI